LNNTTGSNNTANGLNALFSNTGSNNTAVGVGAGGSLTTGDNNIDIGNSGVDGESDTIRIGSEFQTRTFIKSDTTPQFGLIAEEVAKVNPDLVVRDKDGKPYSVRYDQVNAMLLNEFLKEHRKVQELGKGMEVLTAQLKAQAAQIQKVSAQLEVSRPAPQTVLNNQ
jgi:trimeric autotransporter adhesin